MFQLFKKKELDYATGTSLHILIDYYRKFLEEQRKLLARFKALDPEVLKLRKEMEGLRNYFQIDPTPDLDNCQKRRKFKNKFDPRRFK